MTDKIHASTAAPLDLSHSCRLLCFSCRIPAYWGWHTFSSISERKLVFLCTLCVTHSPEELWKDSTSVTANIFLKETINRQNKMNVINSSAWSGCFQRSTHFRSAWKISWSLSTLMGLYKGIGELLTRALQQILPIKKQFTHLWFYFCALLSRKALRRN